MKYIFILRTILLVSHCTIVRDCIHRFRVHHHYLQDYVLKRDRTCTLYLLTAAKSKNGCCKQTTNNKQQTTINKQQTTKKQQQTMKQQTANSK